MGRRVPHILGFYLAAGWGVLQFVDWCVNRYILSPHLVDFTLTFILSLIPSILVIAYFHGAPGKDGWTKVEKIGIPINILTSILILFIFFSAEDLGAATETVLIENEDGEKIERVIPKADFRKNLAIFYLKNNISDPNFSWLRHGVMNALNVDLCQEMFINSSEGVSEKLIEKKFYEENLVPLTIQREIAKELHVEYFFGGDISQNDEGKFIVNTNLYRTKNGKILAKNTFKDEDIFSIIDQMSVQIKHDMEIPTAHIENSVDLPVKEITTESLQALEYWANGLYTFMGKQFDEGVTLMEKATEQDSTFGMAWLNLQGLYVMANQGNKRLETVKKAMEYIYKIPERFQWIVKLVLFDANGEIDKLSQLVKMQVDLYPHDIMAHEMQSMLFLASGDWEAAMNKYKIMLEIDPSRHEYLIKIGEFYEGLLDDDEKSLEYYQKYQSIYPQDANIHYLIGEIQKNLDKIEKAKENFEKALLLDPNNIDAFISIIELDYEGVDQIKEMYGALEMCKTAKDSVNLYQKIEDKLEEHGMFSEMMKNWEIYRTFYPSFSTFFDYAIPQLFYPVYYAKINQTEKAFSIVKEFEATYQLPFSHLIDFSYLLIYAELEEREKATTYLDKAINGINSLGAISLLEMVKPLEAKVYRLNGDYDKAIETLHSSEKSDSKRHKLEFARCYRLKGEYSEALNILESCEGKESLYELGVLHHSMGEIDKAIDYMNEFLEEFQYADPEWKVIKRAKAFIESWENKS